MLKSDDCRQVIAESSNFATLVNNDNNPTPFRTLLEAKVANYDVTLRLLWFIAPYNILFRSLCGNGECPSFGRKLYTFIPYDFFLKTFACFICRYVLNLTAAL